MWHRTLSLALACTLATAAVSWAQPGGGLGGRNQEETLRRLEREVAQLKAEIKKLQSTPAQGRGQFAFDDRRGGGMRPAEGLGPRGGMRPGMHQAGFGPVGGRPRFQPGYGGQRWNRPAPRWEGKRHVSRHRFKQGGRHHHGWKQQPWGQRSRMQPGRGTPPPSREMKRPEPSKRSEPAAFRGGSRSERQIGEARMGPPNRRPSGDRSEGERRRPPSDNR